ncbi:hypothetical protein AVEN_263909-1 [Araneus ventricosus]|uniref:Uncharacterized protein n=1 Tax=Araneus ventricosus TaxID=182803 RepID=A0A4Y2RLB5_ARAVE|nr:hypothetical protein AVEN_252869-1 [Araneus ventricosus]GBN76597.1 hypothetical protein AVEN_263909-1 [Araneus ventricosus]
MRNQELSAFLPRSNTLQLLEYKAAPASFPTLYTMECVCYFRPAEVIVTESHSSKLLFRKQYYNISKWSSGKNINIPKTVLCPNR